MADLHVVACQRAVAHRRRPPPLVISSCRWLHHRSLLRRRRPSPCRPQHCPRMLSVPTTTVLTLRGACTPVAICRVPLSFLPPRRPCSDTINLRIGPHANLDSRPLPQRAFPSPPLSLRWMMSTPTLRHHCHHRRCPHPPPRLLAPNTECTHLGKPSRSPSSASTLMADARVLRKGQLRLLEPPGSFGADAWMKPASSNSAFPRPPARVLPPPPSAHDPHHKSHPHALYSPLLSTASSLSTSSSLCAILLQAPPTRTGAATSNCTRASVPSGTRSSSH
ncbi:hypothetical protein MVEN_00131800 [Mycena venus]|uniref:Uncharacterized protein n=1 Tax=Mycena venus TaxID=2733690 RepID=A0A8H7DFQ2_9AGAR|nr:hypothetical protein MVEN_00131800 [Mycena venus]